MKRLLFVVLAAVLNWAVVGAQVGGNPRESMWRPEIDAYAKADSIENPQKGAILFVGSSSIRMWHNLPQYFPNHKIIQRGVGGSHLEDIIYFADKIVFPYQPKQIVLYEGDNDLKDGFTPESYLEEVKTFVRLVEIHQRGTSIVILSIKPSPARAHLLEKYMKANALLDTFAKQRDNVEYVDITPSVIDCNGEFIGSMFLSDNLHISTQCYKRWAEIIEPYLIK